jgi:hypothetical protein
VLSMGIEQWDIAGLTDLASQLGKRVPAGEIMVQSGVELSGDRLSLVWPWKTWGDRKPVRPTPVMFSRFVSLWEGTPQDIVAFAKKWGMLNVREDGSFWFLAGGRTIDSEFFSEPIETWQYFSQRAYAVLSLAAALRGGRTGGAEDWSKLSSLTRRLAKEHRIRLGNGLFEILADRGFAGWASKPTETQRRFLWVELNLWMRLTGVGLVLGGDVKQMKLQLQINYDGGLLAAIALQLALTVSGSESPSRCSGCGHLYVRTKKSPKPGEANFCETCGRDEAVRQADKRRRDKVQKARRLRSNGLSVDDIAKHLEVRNPGTVRKWIEKGK